MTNNMHVIELIPAYVLDCLEQDEAAAVSAHLAACTQCCAELAAYQSVADGLALAAPLVEPPPALKSRVLGAVQSSGPAPTPRPSWWARVAGFFRRSAPAWSLASLALILLLGASTLVLLGQMNDRRQARVSSMSVLALAGTAAAPQAHGVLIMSADGKYGTLVVDELPPLDADHQYQLWLIDGDGRRTSGGVFDVGAHGYAALEIWSKDALSSFPAFGVTVEPTGGSPSPTGEKVLGTSL